MPIRFGDAITDIFKTPQKWTTILLLSVCLLIPLVGPVVILGYLLQRFSMARQGMDEPDFNFDKFTDYLMIGLWPLLCSIIVSLVFLPLLFLCYIPMIYGVIIAEENPKLMAILFVLGFCLFFIVTAILTIVTMPVVLRSGLMMDFGAGFSWSFIKSFTRKVGASFLGWYLLLIAIVIPASLIGMLAFYIGLFFVSTVMMFAMYHLLFQHYDLFLSRGGEEIEVNPVVLGLPPYYGDTPPPIPPSSSSS